MGTGRDVFLNGKVPVIGEIGMDSVWCDVPLDRQRKALEKQLQFACEIKSR